MPGSKHTFRQLHNECERTCWICYLTDADDDQAEWLHPCKCCGSTKWVHSNCMRLFIDQQRRLRATRSVYCPQCCTKYILVLPDLSYFGRTMKQIDRIATRVCPRLSECVFEGTLFWIGFNYIISGLVDMLNLSTSETLIANGDMLVVLIGYPSIPLLLEVSRALQWESMLDSERRRYFPFTPLDNHRVAPPEFRGNTMTPSETIILLVGLPTISAVFGRIFFGFLKTPWQRFMLGSISFVAARKLLGMYVRNLEVFRRNNMVAVDYTKENLLKYRSGKTQRHSGETTQAI